MIQCSDDVSSQWIVKYKSIVTTSVCIKSTYIVSVGITSLVVSMWYHMSILVRDLTRQSFRVQNKANEKRQLFTYFITNIYLSIKDVLESSCYFLYCLASVKQPGKPSIVYQECLLLAGGYHQVGVILHRVQWFYWMPPKLSPHHPSKPTKW